jgi:hypothetical protein
MVGMKRLVFTSSHGPRFEISRLLNGKGGKAAQLERRENRQRELLGDIYDSSHYLSRTLLLVPLFLHHQRRMMCLASTFLQELPDVILHSIFSYVADSPSLWSQFMSYIASIIKTVANGA